MIDLRFTPAALAATLFFGGPAAAQTPPAGLAAPPAAAGPAAPANPDRTEGEIRKIDKDTRLLTIKHGPIKNLDMPGMTMMFSVKDAAVLDQVRVGEKVRFDASMVDGKLTITALEPLQ